MPLLRTQERKKRILGEERPQLSGISVEAVAMAAGYVLGVELLPFDIYLNAPTPPRAFGNKTGNFKRSILEQRISFVGFIKLGKDNIINIKKV